MLSKNELDADTKGSYVLLIRIPEEQLISIGKLGTVRFPAGDYAYIGSALNGLKFRLSRHLRKDKKLRWHIDYLLQRTAIPGIIVSETEDKVECTIARAVNRQFDAVPGFGSSDCRCPSHLFFAAGELETKVITLLDSLGLKPRLLGTRAWK